MSPAAAQQGTTDAQTVERLERMIKEQQQQVESMQRQLNQLKQTTTEAQTQAREAKKVAIQATTSVQSRVENYDAFRNIVSSSPGKVQLEISGQVNRAVNVIDDGKNADAYFVDNDASNSRARFIGTARATDDLTIGSRIEVAFAPNESSRVNQNDAAEALFVRTAKLPRIEFVALPAEIGRNTIHLMQSGIMFGYVGLFEGIVKRIKKELGLNTRIGATGGLAHVLAAETEAVETVSNVDIRRTPADP